MVLQLCPLGAAPLDASRGSALLSPPLPPSPASSLRPPPPPRGLTADPLQTRLDPSSPQDRRGRCGGAEQQQSASVDERRTGALSHSSERAHSNNCPSASPCRSRCTRRPSQPRSSRPPASPRPLLDRSTRALGSRRHSTAAPSLHAYPRDSTTAGNEGDKEEQQRRALSSTRFAHSLSCLVDSVSSSAFCSDFRQIPDHQEVWADADTDQSLIIELNSLDETVADEHAAASDTHAPSRTGEHSNCSDPQPPFKSLGRLSSLSFF